ncbi:unnamed protein product (macronuclear) [Paramecium tetraurelia]|uniref:Uncharacterized protein n=1 Tax=Paramecium tetraurelia TaxID=5888 RepID=A0C7Z7_PARTE|nr:uncharacterized protein GSPATT00036045001 [Paramecium tetraurelia]CAK66914.1 unnamed protein product [Paramecium tetraurelia]|eukprot:XP_001434311.1 hypothetical protein (macronuclear) [Paramecium tetraurelia strain d4-2]
MCEIKEKKLIIKKRFCEFKISITCKISYKQIPIEPYNMSLFTADLQKEYFSIIRMGGISYINRNIQKRIHQQIKFNCQMLQGQISPNAFRYIFTQFYACQNTSSSQMCAPQKEIEKVLESGQYSVHKSDYLTKLDQSGQPYQVIITNEFTTFICLLLKLFLKNIEFYKHLEMKDQFGNQFRINQMFNQLNGERYLNFIIQFFIIQDQITNKQLTLEHMLHFKLFQANQVDYL